jgi:hypothetical protein
VKHLLHLLLQLIQQLQRVAQAESSPADASWEIAEFFAIAKFLA